MKNDRMILERIKRMEKKDKRVLGIISLRFCLGCLLAVTAFSASVLVYDNLKAGVLFTLLFVLAGAVNATPNTIPQKCLLVLYIIWLVCTAVVTLFLSQLCLNEALPRFGVLVTFLGIILILFCILFFCIITLKFRITTITVSTILILFTCMNHFVFLFRGSEIVPADILSVATAGNVAAEYSFHVPGVMFYAITTSVLYCFLSFSLPPLKIEKKKKTRIMCSIAALVCILAVYVGGQRTKPLLFLQTGSVFNGYLLNFTLMLKESFPQKPNNYNSNVINQISEQYLVKEESESKMPDIIVIMDESFADFSRLGNKLNTDVEVTPFIDNLHDNTLRGYTLSSVFGGGTPNSEYEFLTGNSFLFLPAGSIAYQQFVKQPTYSIVHELKKRGYKTIAMHQSFPNSWMREKTWPLLGFEECLFQDDFPQEDMLRGWGTDQEIFEMIVSKYEENRKSSNTPVFMYAVTIQNHGGYDYSEKDYVTTVHLQEFSQTYQDVEQYLSCIHETDRAVKWLIEYYEKVDHDVVLLFYGDHYPRLNEAFYEEVYGGTFDTLDEQMLQYEVPFFIWTNYKTESEMIELTSMNYLSNELFQRAGLAFSPYQNYLESVRQIIPVCNSFGYYSKSTHSFQKVRESSGEEKEALLIYNQVEWNSVFDKDDKNEIFFSIK